MAVDAPVPRVYVFEFPSKKLMTVLQNFEKIGEKCLPEEGEPTLCPRTVATVTNNVTDMSHISAVALSR